MKLKTLLPLLLFLLLHTRTFAECTTYHNLSGDTTVCEGANSGSLCLENFTGTIIHWEWSTSSGPGATWNTLSHTDSLYNFKDLFVTTYFRAYIDDDLCEPGYSSIATVSVDQPTLTGTLSGDAIACESENNGTISLTGKRGNVLFWQYSTGDGNNWINLPNSSIQYSYTNLERTTSYKLAVKNGVCDTSYSNQVKITIYPIPETGFSSEDVCDGAVSDFINQTTIDSGTVTYDWTFGDGTFSREETPIKQYYNPGTYQVTLKAVSDRGCEKSVTKNTVVNVNPVANFEYENVCLDYPVVLTNSSSISTTENLVYFWEFGDGQTSILAEPNHDYPAPGTFTIKLVTRSNKTNCGDSIYRNVVIYPLPIAFAGRDTAISSGFSVPFNATGGTVYSWLPKDGLTNPEIANPVATPEQTTRYILRVEDEKGCVDRDTVTITVTDDYKVIPSNIITPDGNGMNDTWIVKYIEKYPDCEVFVFNRWGEEIYYTPSYQNNWNATNKNGDILPDGTYYYLIKFKNSKINYKGAITVLRNR